MGKMRRGKAEDGEQQLPLMSNVKAQMTNK